MEMNRGASPFSKGAAPRPLFASFPPRRAARNSREKTVERCVGIAEINQLGALFHQCIKTML